MFQYKRLRAELNLIANNGYGGAYTASGVGVGIFSTLGRAE